jgi:hypothetical protein
MLEVMASNRYTLAVNDELVRDLDGVAAFLYSLKRIQAQPKTRDWLDTEPLRAVRAGLVTVK